MDNRLPSILLILNIANEVELVWKQRWGWTTLAYHMTKAVALTALICGLAAMRAPDLPGKVCVHYAIFIGGSLFIVSGFADVLLTFRLYYMYGRDRRLLYFSLAVYAAIDIASVIISCLNFPSADDYTTIPNIGSCFIRLVWQLPAAWLLGLGYHVYLAVLALLKVRQAYAHRKLLGVRLSLLGLLVQGNLEYYMMAHGSRLTMTSMGIFGPKLIRDMRRMLVPGGQDPTFSTIHFATQQNAGDK
ncbi:hypothetical protein AURDEDRAFT_150872 [Auricularia subglabra TFB-10046 SS5]|nr:hypothetical protein AURDEDRAFT_150872 [Auricularia subglabra TFB-10046 SS5]